MKRFQQLKQLSFSSYKREKNQRFFCKEKKPVYLRPLATTYYMYQCSTGKCKNNVFCMYCTQNVLCTSTNSTVSRRTRCCNIHTLVYLINVQYGISILVAWKSQIMLNFREGHIRVTYCVVVLLPSFHDFRSGNIYVSNHITLSIFR